MTIRGSFAAGEWLSGPNEDFFKRNNLVCQCDVPRHKSVGTISDSPEYMKLYVCVKCSGLERCRLTICTSCRALFYRFFSHPKQTLNKMFCWHCLEAGLSYGKISEYEAKMPKCPPPDYLLAPAVKPKSLGEMTLELEALLESL